MEKHTDFARAQEQTLDDIDVKRALIAADLEAFKTTRAELELKVHDLSMEQLRARQDPYTWHKHRLGSSYLKARAQ
eukprot:8076124-Pyramimonas_sp.AAC.1